MESPKKILINQTYPGKASTVLGWFTPLTEDELAKHLTPPPPPAWPPAKWPGLISLDPTPVPTIRRLERDLALSSSESESDSDSEPARPPPQPLTGPRTPPSTAATLPSMPELGHHPVVHRASWYLPVDGPSSSSRALKIPTLRELEAYTPFASKPTRPAKICPPKREDSIPPPSTASPLRHLDGNSPTPAPSASNSPKRGKRMAENIPPPPLRIRANHLAAIFADPSASKRSRKNRATPKGQPSVLMKYYNKLYRI